FVREANDLVLERRAIARPYAADLAVEERRAVDVHSHQVAHAIVRVYQVAVHLRTLDRRREKREGHRRRVAAFDDEASLSDLPIEIDAVAIEARRRAGLQASTLEAECLQGFGEVA